MFERAIRKNITETVCQILCGLKSFNEGGYYSDPYRAVLMVRAKIKKSSYEKLNMSNSRHIIYWSRMMREMGRSICLMRLSSVLYVCCYT